MIRAGGEAFALYAAWRFGGADPYRTFNSLDADYRPIGDRDAEPRPPPSPWRIRMFTYGCAMYAQEEEVQKVAAMSGGSVTRQAG